jgi:uncharacterized repeat protein (TIGR01451 family)
MADIKNEFTSEVEGRIVKSNADVVNYNEKPAKLENKKSNNAPTNATIGTIYTYTCTISNKGGSIANLVIFSDILQSNIQYITGSFKVDGITKLPVNISPLLYTIPSIAVDATVVITFDVKIL